MTAKRTDSAEDKTRLSRRDLLTKYGPYTAPVVIALLTPTHVYADNTRKNSYPTLSACLIGDDHPTMMTVNHCEKHGF